MGRKPLSESHRAAISRGLLRASSEGRPPGARRGVPGHRQDAATRTRIGDKLRHRRGQPLTPEQRAIALANLSKLAPPLGNRRAKDAKILGECYYCGDPAQTYDHKIPRGRPGWDAQDNVVPACWSCNASKRDRTPEEWAEALKKTVLQGLKAQVRVARILR